MMESSSSAALVVHSAPPEEEEEDGERLEKDLAVDDIVEIFARLPVKSLLRFRCVSKFWNSLILSPSFIALQSSHSHRKNQVSLLSHSFELNVNAVASPPNTTYSFGFGDVTENLTFSGYECGVQIVGCFNGVVCFSVSERPQQKYALWNPATRQLREIGDAPMDAPHIEKGWYGSGFYFDPVTNDFKIAQILLIPTEGGGETRALINVFSTATNSWIEKNVHVPYRIVIGGASDISNARGFSCVNGYMHWVVDLLHWRDLRSGEEIDMSFDREDMYILSYNINNEVFERIEVPSIPVCDYCHLSAYKGSLAVFAHERRTGSRHSYDEVVVWVMSDCGGANQSWSKLLTCKPSITIRLAVGFYRKDNVDLILLWKDQDYAPYLYDPETGNTNKFWKKDSGWHTFLYSESLASLY